MNTYSKFTQKSQSREITKYVSGYIVKSGGWEGSGKIVNGCDFFFEIDEVMKFLKLKVMMTV